MRFTSLRTLGVAAALTGALSAWGCGGQGSPGTASATAAEVVVYRAPT